MLLKNLIANIDGEIGNIDVCGITSDSREVAPGYAFVCIKGVNNDGHEYAQKAVELGASVVFTQQKMGVNNEIIVPDTRELYADMCAKWFSNPADSLKLIGVTGTNGMLG